MKGLLSALTRQNNEKMKKGGVKMKKWLKRKEGFTLVELAIVLVIIGILLAAILKGQAMIKQAKIKRIKADVDSIVAAVYSYQDKYGYLPGDDPNDHSTDLNATGCRGGNADGIFSNIAEDTCAWQEIIGAGFVAGDPTVHNESKVAKTHPFGGRYLFRYGTRYGKSGNYIFIDNLPVDVAKSLDEKYDDGAYNTGDIRANSNYTGTGVRDMYWYVF